MKKLLMAPLLLLTSQLMAQPENVEALETSGLSNNSLFLILLLVALVLLVTVMVVAGAINNLAGNKKLWPGIAGKSGAVLVTALLSSGLAMAQSTTSVNQAFQASDAMIYIMWGLVFILAIVALYLSMILRKLLSIIKPKPVAEKAQSPSLVGVLQSKLADAHPVSQEEEILLDHEYDGIRELDNNLPPWWKYGFYISIVFAIIYMIRFHVTGSGDLQEVEYQKEMAEAEIKKEEYIRLTGGKIDENTVTLLVDAESISSGKAIYTQSCAACHGGALEGGVGPNLADEYWIHGGSVNDVFKLIKYGNPQKGMIAWQGQLGPKQIQEVTSYILSMQGTNPPNAKEPQGEKYLPATADSQETEL